MVYITKRGLDEEKDGRKGNFSHGGKSVDGSDLLQSGINENEFKVVGGLRRLKWRIL